jgi:hypothetical protein
LKNRLNRENRKKNNQKNQIVKKNRLNRLKFWKNRLVRFWFYKPKTEKTEPKPKKNRAKLVFVLKNRTETGRFEPVSIFFLNRFGYFFYKNQTEPKMITPNSKWLTISLGTLFHKCHKFLNSFSFRKSRLNIISYIFWYKH